jgi:hypothetical protein
MNMRSIVVALMILTTSEGIAQTSTTTTTRTEPTRKELTNGEKKELTNEEKKELAAVLTGMSVTFLVFVGFLYFLPIITAVLRSHPDSGAIFVVNLFLGWTIIGWVIALAWAFTSGGGGGIKNKVVIYKDRND